MKSNRSSGIILKFGNKVLLCKRADHETYSGKWFIPSGHLEANETPKDCAYREFYEETNIKIEEEISLVGFITKKDEEGKPKGLIYVYLYESDKKKMPNLAQIVALLEQVHFNLKNGKAVNDKNDHSQIKRC